MEQNVNNIADKDKAVVFIALRVNSKLNYTSSVGNLRLPWTFNMARIRKFIT